MSPLPHNQPPRPPVIEKMEHRIATLQRRQEHLEASIREDEEDGVVRSRTHYDRAEHAALEAALRCMRYVQEVTRGQ